MSHRVSGDFISSAVLFVVLLWCPAAATAQVSAEPKPIDINWTIPAVYFATSSADALSTWGGHRAGCFEGERNPRYHLNGDWRTPDYGRIWRDNAILLGTAIGTEALSSWLVSRKPHSKVAKGLRFVSRGVFIAGSARNAFAAGRNIGRCF